MAQHQSAKKRIRQNAKRRLENRYFAKTMRNAVRDLRAIESHEEAMKKLPQTISYIDKVAKRNQIHKNKASNLKSKLMRHVESLK